jgi:hypothetical protein
MPPQKYTPKPPVFECHQFNGANLKDLAEWAPVLEKDGKAHLTTPMGDLPVKPGDWVMQDIYGLFTLISDEYFQKGFKPGGGPAE